MRICWSSAPSRRAARCTPARGNRRLPGELGAGRRRRVYELAELLRPHCSPTSASSYWKAAGEAGKEPPNDRQKPRRMSPRAPSWGSCIHRWRPLPRRGEQIRAPCRTVHPCARITKAGRTPGLRPQGISPLNPKSTTTRRSAARRVLFDVRELASACFTLGRLHRRARRLAAVRATTRGQSERVRHLRPGVVGAMSREPVRRSWAMLRGRPHVCWLRRWPKAIPASAGSVTLGRALTGCPPNWGCRHGGCRRRKNQTARRCSRDSWLPRCGWGRVTPT